MPPAAYAKASDLIEVFSAIQGEGLVVGVRQLFVRFGHCDIKCAYCDTPLCHVDLPRARIEVEAGKRVFESWRNPVPWDDLAFAVGRLVDSGPRHESVSLTGGEPLLHTEAIQSLAPRFRRLGLPVYLETNGHLHEAMSQVLDVVDQIAMDIKTPATTGLPARYEDNRTFLALLEDRDVFVKIVVGEGMSDEELGAALGVVEDVAPSTPVILQPVTPHRGVGTPPAPSRLLEMHALASSRLPHVRAIPQTHKMTGQL